MSGGTDAQPIIHHPPRWHGFVMWGALVLFGAFAGTGYGTGAPVWQWGTLTVFSVLAVVALVDLTMTRVELGPEALVLVSNFRRRVIPRQEIVSVTWGKGVTVSVELADGAWLALPEVGPGNRGLANSVRAWPERTEQEPSTGDRRSP